MRRLLNNVRELNNEDQISKEDNESKATDEKEQSLVSCNKSSLLEDETQFDAYT